jgi:hypothetical protein
MKIENFQEAFSKKFKIFVENRTNTSVYELKSFILMM